MDDDDYVTVLRREFSREEGTFLFQLHHRAWDWSSFNRLAAAMLACCQTYDEHDQSPTLFETAHDRTQLPRWITAGFWFVVTSAEE
jgi:hypothetical protein